MTLLHEPETGLIQLSFVSQVREYLPCAALARIERQALDFNLANGLTGELHFLNGHFQQTIEGPRVVLLPLAARILSDARHTSIAVESFGAIARRRFRSWRSFGFGSADALSDTQFTVESNVAVLIPRQRREPDCTAEHRGSAVVVRF